MMIDFILIFNVVGQPRLIRRYNTGKKDDSCSEADIIKECLMKDQSRECFMFEYKSKRIVFLKYGSLFTLVSTDEEENDLAICEFINNFMDIVSTYIGDLIMLNIDKVYAILDEMVVHGRIMESIKAHILSPLQVLASS